MRVGRVTVIGVVAASALGAGVASSSLLSRPALAQVSPVKSVGVQLPVQDFRDIELDENGGRLYLAQGVGAGSPLVVTDLDGRLQSRFYSDTDHPDLPSCPTRRTSYQAS